MSSVSLPAARGAASQITRRRPFGVLVVLAIFAALLALLPPGFVIGVGIDTGWPTVKALIFRPRVGELLSNTLLLVVCAVPACVVVGIAMAWLTDRTSLPGRRVWSPLSVAPLPIPAFVLLHSCVGVAPAPTCRVSVD